jgi:hypothetical protein
MSSRQQPTSDQSEFQPPVPQPGESPVANQIGTAFRALGQGFVQAITEAESRRREFSRDRYRWLLGLVPIIFAGLRVLVVSRGDPETLRALVQNLNVAALVLATLLPLGATLACWFSVLALLRFRFGRGQAKGGSAAMFFFLLPTSVILVLLAMPLRHIVWNVGVFALIVAILALSAISQYLRAKVLIKVFAAGALLWLAAVWTMPFIILLARAEMWLPKESLTLRSSTVRPVYVLSSDERWTSYMDDCNKVHVVHTDDITNRESLRSSNSMWQKTLADLIWPRYGTAANGTISDGDIGGDGASSAGGSFGNGGSGSNDVGAGDGGNGGDGGSGGMATGHSSTGRRHR